MKEIFIVVILLCLEGCASRQPVNCEWRLKPINVPTKVKETKPPKTSTPAPVPGIRNKDVRIEQ